MLEQTIEKKPRKPRLKSVALSAAVWLSLFALVYILRSFFLLIFLTFVFSYVQSHLVHALSGRISRRTPRVVLVGCALLGVLIGIGSFIVPSVIQQAKLLADNYPTILQSVDTELEHLTSRYTFFEMLTPSPPDHEDSEWRTAGVWSPKHSRSAHIFKQLIGISDEGANEEDVRHVANFLRDVGQKLVSVGSAFFLSLLFSFLIVLDLPRLTASVQSLKHTKVGFIYEEVAPSIQRFGSVVGTMLEAQLYIALANTVLTALVLLFLGLGDRLAFLSLIVFFCSFIPVAGVFISSVPICLMVLARSGGMVLLVAVGLIWIVHMIEAYILNPRIFGRRLHVNPVMVLIILTVGGKLFHIWGLVLGLPICVYVFSYAIRKQNEENPAEGSASVGRAEN